MAQTHPYSRQTLDAVKVLGLEIARARRARRQTLGDLAERAGVSRPTLRKVEAGDPTVSIGTTFEVATLVGIDLFGLDRSGLASTLDRSRDRLALLPSRVRRPSGPVRDDF